MSLLRHRVLLPAAPAAPAPRARREVVSLAHTTPCTLLLPVLYAWLCCGAIGLVLFPELRGDDPLIGWRPFWLLLWPASSMVLLGLCRRARARMR